jgi:hypothetical protein
MIGSFSCSLGICLALPKPRQICGGSFADEEERRQAIFAGFTRRIADHPAGPSLKAALRRLSDHCEALRERTDRR